MDASRWAKGQLDLMSVQLQAQELPFSDRMQLVSDLLGPVARGAAGTWFRNTTLPSDRRVAVVHPDTGVQRSMLMFGSNNYLGMACHPAVREAVKRAIDKWGCGVGGAPALSGTTPLHKELEARLTAFVQAEDTMLFASGFEANLGITSALMGDGDLVIHDERCHASFYDGLKMRGIKALRWRHNDCDDLLACFATPTFAQAKQTFVAVEGVYSMQGDIAPLDRIVPLCEEKGALLVLDDAHGTGVMGAHGRGTPEHHGVLGRAGVIMGTLSKSFAMTGGFVSGTKPIIDYMRWFARSHMFSAVLPVTTIAAVLAAIETLEKEPAILAQLWRNIRRAGDGLAKAGFDVNGQSSIIMLKVPEGMDPLAAAAAFDEAGIFVNLIGYPALPRGDMRFRVSLMASHSDADVDRLVEVAGNVWARLAP